MIVWGTFPSVTIILFALICKHNEEASSELNALTLSV